MVLFAGSVYSGSKALANLVLYFMAMLVNLFHVLKKKLRIKKEEKWYSKIIQVAQCFYFLGIIYWIGFDLRRFLDIFSANACIFCSTKPFLSYYMWGPNGCHPNSELLPYCITFDKLIHMFSALLLEFLSVNLTALSFIQFYTLNHYLVWFQLDSIRFLTICLLFFLWH